MVNNDSDTTSFLLANSGFLEFSEGESTALTDLGVVADGLGTDGRAEGLEWADSESGSLGLASVTASEFTSWLVEPGADTPLPVLAEVVVVKDVVVCETHLNEYERICVCVCVCVYTNGEKK